MLDVVFLNALINKINMVSLGACSVCVVAVICFQILRLSIISLKVKLKSYDHRLSTCHANAADSRTFYGTLTLRETPAGQQSRSDSSSNQIYKNV